MDSIRQREIDRCSTAVEDEEKSQWMAGSYEELIAAKKENVALQLEAEYRARIKDAFTQVLRTNILESCMTFHLLKMVLLYYVLLKS